MNEKEHANNPEPDNDILNEFDGIDREIAEQMLSYRQAASPALRRRVMEITREPVQTRTRLLPPSPARRALALTVIAILILVLPFALPQVRAAAAQILLLLQSQGITEIVSPVANGSLTLSPTPIFTVRQPSALPDGFVRTAVHYRSHMQTLNTEQVSEAPSNPSLAARLAEYESDQPYLLIGYQASNSQYFLLFQRTALTGEALPAGSSLTIDGHPATLRTENDVLIVTWIADDTWITLETNTSESILIEVAQGLRVTQQPEDTAPTVTEAADLPLCDSENLTSHRFLLGRLDDQVFWGSLWIYLYEGGNSPDAVANGIDSPGVTEAMLYQRGLDALRDPRLAGQSLSTPPDVVVETSSEQQCLKPDSDLFGYVVLEIWERQVNAAFVGTGGELRERAITVLENELAE